MKYFLTFSFFLYSVFSFSQINILKKASDEAQKFINVEIPLSSEQVSDALIEALIIGSKFSVNSASVVGGFTNNSTIRIPFPEDAIKIKISLNKIGFSSSISEFENSMNKSAELAAEIALLTLINAIKQMSIKDAFKILNGADNAATIYLKEQTSLFLYEEFHQIILETMKEVQIAKKWNPLLTKYNSIPFTEKINPDLEDYITRKTIDGLFVLISIEEKNIRENPSARVSLLLKKVFK
jgi:hypothetical protein